MAEKILNTRILLKIDTLENWNASTLPLKKGELAIATVAANEGLGLTDPVTMIKIGEDGVKTFKDLEWNLYAKASDVLAAAKTEAGLTKFVQDVLAGEGIASDEVVGALAGRVTTAEGKITTLEGKMTAVEGKAAANETAIGVLNGLVGDTKVAIQIQDAIKELKLDETYAAKALEGTVADHIADTVSHVTTSDKTKWNAALQASDVAAGATNGTSAVKGTDVAVTGLGSAAFTESTAYDAAGAAAGAESAAKAYAKEYADGLAKNYDAVGSAAAAQAAAEAYADGLAGNYDVAGAAAAAEAAAKKHADDELSRLVGDTKVETQIDNAITDLDLANTYDAKGAAATAETNAKTYAKNYADGLNSDMNTRVEALEAIDHDHENKSVLDGITAEKVAAWDVAEQNAVDYADALDEVMDGRVAALEAKFGEGEGNVESQIATAVAAEAKLREDADKALDARVKAIEDDYLVEEDKTALQGQITTNAGEITTLKGLVGDQKVEDRVAAAIKEEADRAKGIEGGLRTDVDAIKEDYLKASDKEALQAQINTIMSNPDAEGAINSINEFTQYVKDHGTIADGFRTDIDANADAIEAIEADYLKAADKTALQGSIDGVAGRVTTAEGKITALETASATHATKTELEGVSGKVTTAEGKISTLEGKMSTAEGAIDALEELVGDKKVEVRIEEAIAAENLAQYAKAADLDVAEGKIEVLEGKAHTHANNTELDKFVDGDKAKLDSAVQTVTAGTGLKATKTGTDVAIAFDDDVVFIFDCGGAEVEA